MSADADAGVRVDLPREWERLERVAEDVMSADVLSDASQPYGFVGAPIDEQLVRRKPVDRHCGGADEAVGIERPARRLHQAGGVPLALAVTDKY